FRTNFASLFNSPRLFVWRTCYDFATHCRQSGVFRTVRNTVAALLRRAGQTARIALEDCGEREGKLPSTAVRNPKCMTGIIGIGPLNRIEQVGLCVFVDPTAGETRFVHAHNL